MYNVDQQISNSQFFPITRIRKRSLITFIRLLFFGFLRDAISILFVSQQKTRRILNRAKEKKKNRRRKIDSFDSSG